jgi:type IV secretory pathway VirB2 component (pilin)
MKNPRASAVAVALMMMTTSGHAFAAGGGTFLSGLVDWITGNVATTLGTLAIVAAAVMMMAMRMHILAILAVCAGIWLIFNASNVISFIQS